MLPIPKPNPYAAKPKLVINKPAEKKPQRKRQVDSNEFQEDMKENTWDIQNI